MTAEDDKPLKVLAATQPERFDKLMDAHRALHMAVFDVNLWLKATHPQHPTVQ